MKRIISVILVLAMILILPPFSTVAADQGPYYAIEGEKTVKSGETVSLKVAIYNNPGIISLRFRVTYDENLELVEIVDGKLLSGMSEPSPNVASPYILKWADYKATTNNTANGVVVTLVFRAKANLVSATAAVGIEHVEGRNANGNKVTFINAAAAIAVTCGHVNVSNDAGTRPGCESAGVTAGVYCEDCKNWISGHEDMAATGHKMQYVDNNDGTHDRLCRVCGEVESHREGHAFEAGSCVCGATSIQGDLDFDGDVDADDLAVLEAGLLPANYAGSCELSSEQKQRADINGDGEINSADRVLLARSLLDKEHPLYRPLVP